LPVAAQMGLGAASKGGVASQIRSLTGVEVASLVDRASQITVELTIRQRQVVDAATSPGRGVLR
jgi:hypothetical protein